MSYFPNFPPTTVTYIILNNSQNILIGPLKIGTSRYFSCLYNTKYDRNQFLMLLYYKMLHYDFIYAHNLSCFSIFGSRKRRFIFTINQLLCTFILLLLYDTIIIINIPILYFELLYAHSIWLGMKNIDTCSECCRYVENDEVYKK